MNIPQPEIKVNTSGMQDLEAINTMSKNTQMQNTAFCSAITLIIMSVLTINIFVIIYGIFVMAALNSTFNSWKEWQRAIRAFYIVCLVVLVIAILIMLIILIAFSSNSEVSGSVIGAIGLVVYPVETYFTIRARNAIRDLYPISEAEKDNMAK